MMAPQIESRPPITAGVTRGLLITLGVSMVVIIVAGTKEIADILAPTLLALQLLGEFEFTLGPLFARPTIFVFKLVLQGVNARQQFVDILVHDP